MKHSRDHSKAGGVWYRAVKDDVHAVTFGHVSKLRQKNRSYRDTAMFYMKLRAGSQDVTGDGLYMGDDGRMRYNLGASTVDTMISIVASQRAVPQSVVKGGDWNVQRKAKLRTRVMQTQAIELKLHELSSKAYDDACTTMIGALHFMRDPDTGLPHIERVLPLELVWDPTEAMAGYPRSLYRVRLVDRAVLKALYPSKAKDLDGADGPSVNDQRDFALYRQRDCDQVVVVEAWHLPSSSKANDGRHVICTSTCSLSDSPWKRSRFPIVVSRWAPRQLGFLGRSLIEEVRPAQQRIHKLIDYVEQCQDLGSKPQVWVHGNSQVEAEQIDNVAMSVNRYYGDSPPTFFTFDATPHDLEASIEQIREHAWSQLGLTQAQLQGEKPSGVTSAVAMKTVDDIGSRRHAQNLKHHEAFMVECFQALADLNDDIAEQNPAFEVRASIRARFLETSKWAELKIEEGDERIGVFPISALPTTPTGRYDRIEEWVQAGWITREVALLLHGMPDLEAYEDIETADIRYVQHQVGQILNGKLGILPESYQDLAIAADYARKKYIATREEGAPEEILQELRNFIDAIKDKQDELAAKQAAKQQPPAPAMTAVTAAPAPAPAMAA